MVKMRFLDGRIFRFRRAGVLGFACLISAAGVVACTATPAAPEAPKASASSTTDAAGGSPSESSATEVAGQKAINVYLGMWHAMAGAARTSDWKSSTLSQYTTGEALSTISRGLYTDHQNGLVTKGAPRNEPAVAALNPADEPETVTISDCGDSTDWLKYRADSGQRANDGPGGRRAITAVVNRQDDDRWLVSAFAVRAVGTC